MKYKNGDGKKKMIGEEVIYQKKQMINKLYKTVRNIPITGNKKASTALSKNVIATKIILVL